MKNSPLLLKGINYSKVALEHREDQPNTTIPAQVGVKVQVGVNNETPNLFYVKMTVSLSDQPKGEKSHITGEVIAVGTFEHSKDASEELKQNLISITAPSILYSSAREMISLVTGRFPGGCVQLGTMSFQKMDIPKVPAKL